MTYEWDNRNRLTQVTDWTWSSGTWHQGYTYHYSYDAFDRKVRKAMDGGYASVYVYDGQNLLLQFDCASFVSATSNNLSHYYLHGPAVDQVLADETRWYDDYYNEEDAEVYWLLGDNQNTVRDVVAYDYFDYHSVSIDHIRYDSFGNITSQTNPGIQPHFTYTGRELDSGTGLYYYRARWYDAKNGRFISEDPIEYAAGDANLYRYCGNGPTNKTDPSGTDESPNEIDNYHYGMFDIYWQQDPFNSGCNTNFHITYIPSPQDKLTYSNIRLLVSVRTKEVRRGCFGDIVIDNGWHTDLPKDPMDLNEWPTSPSGAEWIDHPGVDTYSNDTRSCILNLVTLCWACPPIGAILSLDQEWQATAIGTRNGISIPLGMVSWSQHARYKWYLDGDGHYDGKSGEEIKDVCKVDVTVWRDPKKDKHTYVRPF